MTHMGYHTLLALVALCNAEKLAIQWFRMHHIYFFKELLAIRRILSLVGMITNTNFSNCPNVFKIGVVWL